MGQMVNPGVPVHNDSLGENNVKSASTFENPTELISFPGINDKQYPWFSI